MGVSEKTKIGTIDLTPTWAALLPVFLHALAEGTPLGQRIAKEELARMATMADAYNALRLQMARHPIPIGPATRD